MTQPLTQEIAGKYGYGKEVFQKWIKNYVDSLKVKERMHQIKPIKQFKPKVGMPLLTEEIRKYVLEIIRGSDGSDSHLILNPNYIYILQQTDSDVSYYIPIGIPLQKRSGFPKSTKIIGIYSRSKEMRGRYEGKYTHTWAGFNLLTSEIIGILEFPTQVKFINWQENPLEVKE